jgi:hypothetical protein
MHGGVMRGGRRLGVQQDHPAVVGIRAHPGADAALTVDMQTRRAHAPSVSHVTGRLFTP